MATYAIIGATGNCGTALLDNLSRNPTVNIRAYCRNKNKLVNTIPHLLEKERVEIFEGSIHDVDLISQCIKDAKAIFHVVSTNTNIPNCNVGLDTAGSIIEALKKLKAQRSPGFKPPKIVLLSSATIDDHLSRNLPWIFRSILLTSAYYVYDDLKRTEKFLRAQEDIATTIFIKPGGLSVDKQRGHKLDLDHEETFVSYLDLAAAMIEAADNVDDRYDMKNVGVVNTNGGARFPSGTPLCILTGLLRYYFPFLHPYLPSPGPA
ncbi:putative NAD-dependent epimerase/dehydratase [Talaromyces proteolyticus]|uniref:NAD-dependent epimerase/dehydratase n=1 Tax=Talaromyces proteolyticus TaxID=1131652 RepID=A0AAD4KU24_9EURO|nr:putative NAD-dependent epimerase/dehydratase [Talaromyces proteolyticus]KAH8698800.1 putative NAD-dependent epimerase/dehydratase [Talaromyces proteolyticus]